MVSGSGLSKGGWNVTWSNQWEPVRVHTPSDAYVSHFVGEPLEPREHPAVALTDIPYYVSLVGFPCQDYSVATTKARGIEGRKGVLWWEIRRVVEARRPSYILLENVDRLLKSPTAQRGRDFETFWCLNSLGYSVEWRELNAADYAFLKKPADARSSSAPT